MDYRSPRSRGRFMLLVLLPALVIAGGVGSIARAAPGGSAMPASASQNAVVVGETDFGFLLLTQLAATSPGKNVFLSPLSISQCLTMALNGAGGQTRKDMAQSLRVDGVSLDDLNKANGALTASLTKPDPQVQLTIANALWADSAFTFNPDFQKRCADDYGANTATLDFSSPAAADAINSWVKHKTQDKIERLVSPLDTRGASAILTNAVYFHGKWATPFQADNTKDGPFTLEGGQTKTLPLMSQPRETYPYYEEPQFQMAALPYGGGRASMVVVLPRGGAALEDVFKDIRAASWDAALAKMRPALLAVTLPRFRVEYDVSLAKPLAALGMAAPFAPGADFTPMGLTHGVISEVVHKAVVEVNEQGTVAAAATGVVMRSLAMPVMRPPTVFRVDHPFFCVIRDNETGAVLFAGVISDPEALQAAGP